MARGDDGYEDEYLVSGARQRQLRGRVPGEWHAATRTSTWWCVLQLETLRWCVLQLEDVEVVCVTVR